MAEVLRLGSKLTSVAHLAFERSADLALAEATRERATASLASAEGGGGG